MRVLVVGGAGYIGSHMVQYLTQNGHHVTVLDNLCNGYRDALGDAELIEADMGDRSALRHVLTGDRFDGVIHFASFIQVGESVSDPAKYYRNNVAETIGLLDTLLEAGIHRLIFSSTAAIFGEPQRTPIDESHPVAPVNPYGWTKLFIEQVLSEYDRAYGFRSISLRYFNAAGADPNGQLGERHEPETHLIPLVLQAASGRRPNITVFGSDYDTPDGTCIRDYVHVSDLCQAHQLALEWLQQGHGSGAYNLGTGQGCSVREVIAAAEKVSNRAISTVDAPRRAGDPARLVADPSLAQRQLGWRPRFNDIETIVAHAWRWEVEYHCARQIQVRA